MGEQIREALEKAYAESEKPAEGGGPPEGSAQPVGAAPEAKPPESKTPESKPPEGAKPPEQDEKSSEEGKTPLEDKKTPEQKTPEGAKPPEGAKAPEKKEGTKAPEDQKKPTVRAPASWKAEAREVWAQVPERAREEIAKREREIEHVLSNTRNSRKLAEDFRTAVDPFMPLITAKGSSPIEAVKNLMGTAAGLTMGTPKQKAQIIANILEEYSVDIGELDQALTARQSGKSPGDDVEARVSAELQKRMAPINQFMSQIQGRSQQVNQQQEQEIASTVREFADNPDNEFWEDVRDDVADLLDNAANRGRSMSIEEAYKAACQINPDVQKILNQRKLAKEQEEKTRLERSNAASRTLRGGNAGAPGSNGGGGADRRAALLNAIDQHSR